MPIRKPRSKVRTWFSGLFKWGTAASKAAATEPLVNVGQGTELPQRVPGTSEILAETRGPQETPTSQPAPLPRRVRRGGRSAIAEAAIGAPADQRPELPKRVPQAESAIAQAGAGISPAPQWNSKETIPPVPEPAAEPVNPLDSRAALAIDKHSSAADFKSFANSVNKAVTKRLTAASERITTARSAEHAGLARLAQDGLYAMESMVHAAHAAAMRMMAENQATSVEVSGVSVSMPTGNGKHRLVLRTS